MRNRFEKCPKKRCNESSRIEAESQAVETRAMSVDREAQRRRTIESEISPLNTPRNEEQSAEIDITNACDDSESARAIDPGVSPLDTSEKANAQPRSRISNVEWSRLRGILRRLYIEENRPLHHVIRRMETDYGLVVTYGNAPSILWKDLSHAPNLI